MRALGVIFSNSEAESLYEITRRRTTGSIPFGGRYRLIDFALSNMVSARISNVAVLTQRNYQSLMDHLGSGKEWDMSRKNGGLVIFPPFSSHKSDSLYSTRLEALKSIKSYIEKQNPEIVVLSDSDGVNTVNLQEVLEKHEENRADITITYKNMNVTNDLMHNLNLSLDSFGRVVSAKLKTSLNTLANLSINLFVFKRSVLMGLIDDAISRGLTDLFSDIIFPNIASLRVFGYEYKGIYMHISNMQNYYQNNIKLLNSEVREQLFEQRDHGIYTKVRDSAPTKYGNNVYVENSFIADGCEIEGQVINSVLFRGVKVGAGAVVKDSILMQDTIVGNNANLTAVITDKNVIVSDRVNLMGCEQIPYYIGKNSRI